MKTIELRSHRKIEIDGELFSIDIVSILEWVIVNDITITDRHGLIVDPVDSVYKKIVEVYC